MYDYQEILKFMWYEYVFYFCSENSSSSASSSSNSQREAEMLSYVVQCYQRAVAEERSSSEVSTYMICM